MINSDDGGFVKLFHVVRGMAAILIYQIKRTCNQGMSMMK